MNINTSKEEKKCPKCKLVKARNEFYSVKGQLVKVSGLCKPCILISNKEKRQKVKKRAVEYLGRKCSKCEYDKCLSALEFHHIDNRTKDKLYVNYRLNFNKLKIELDKCILLCANCHRELHEKEDNIVD